MSSDVSAIEFLETINKVDIRWGTATTLLLNTNAMTRVG
jgi:hypothetical protein